MCVKLYIEIRENRPTGKTQFARTLSTLNDVSVDIFFSTYNFFSLCLSFCVFFSWLVVLPSATIPLSDESQKRINCVVTQATQYIQAIYTVASLVAACKHKYLNFGGYLIAEMNSQQSRKIIWTKLNLVGIEIHVMRWGYQVRQSFRTLTLNCIDKNTHTHTPTTKKIMNLTMKRNWFANEWFVCEKNFYFRIL